MKLRYFNKAKTNNSDIRFSYPKEMDVQYERPYMPYDEFHEKITKRLMLEKEAAVNALAVIRSERGINWKEQQMHPLRKRFQELLSAMTELETLKMREYQEFQKGKIGQEEYFQRKGSIADKLQALDVQAEPIIAELARIDELYSDRNPWIRLFMDIHEEDALIRKKIKKFVDHVEIFRFESVELVPMELKWKQALPEEWLGGEEYGKEK